MLIQSAARKLSMITSPRSAEEPTRRCPRCLRGRLLFTKRAAVLTPAGEFTRPGVDVHNAKERLRYEDMWVCQNPRCEYHERPKA